jgi:hypothetical protein
MFLRNAGYLPTSLHGVTTQKNNIVKRYHDKEYYDDRETARASSYDLIESVCDTDIYLQQ